MQSRKAILLMEQKKAALLQKAKELCAEQDCLKNELRIAFNNLAEKSTVKKTAFDLLLDGYDAYEEHDIRNMHQICRQIRIEELSEPFEALKINHLQRGWNAHITKFDQLNQQILKEANLEGCTNGQAEKRIRGWQSAKRVCVVGACLLGALVAVGTIVAVSIATGGAAAAAAIGTAAASTAAGTGMSVGSVTAIAAASAGALAVGSAFGAGYYKSDSMVDKLNEESAKRKKVQKNITETLDSMQKFNENIKFISQLVSNCEQDQEEILAKGNREGQTDEEYLMGLIERLYKGDVRRKKKNAINGDDIEATAYVKILRLKTKLKALVLLANKSSNELLFKQRR